MTGLIEGGCRCGAIRYRVKRTGLPRTYACHCLDCQTWTGSAFSVQFIEQETALEIEGEPQLFALSSKDGKRTSYQRGCARCFTRLYNTNTARPGMVMIRAGTLDHSNEAQLVAHIWAKRKVSGIDIPPAVPAWDENPSMEDFFAALGG